jgi:preprotein translocase subunit SecE
VIEQVRRLRRFVTEVWSELKKTSWPDRNEVMGTTLVVVVTVVICAFYLWVVDTFLSRGMTAVLDLLK